MDGCSNVDPSLGLPPALPVPPIPATQPVIEQNFNQATMQWSGASAQNKSWASMVIRAADIKRDISDRQKMIDDALENFENVGGTMQSAQIPERFAHLLMRILKSDGMDPTFVLDDPINNFRKTIVRLIHRLLTLDIARPLHEAFVKDITSIIEIDNEDIGIVCLKLLLEMVKVARASVGINVPPAPLFNNPSLLAFIVKLLKRWTSLPLDIKRVYDMGNLKIPTNAETGKVDVKPVAEQLLCSVDIVRSSPDDASANGIIILPKANNSLRFLAESTYVIMFSQQHTRQKVTELYPTFSQDMMNLMAVDLPITELEQFIQSLANRPMEYARVTGAYHEFMYTYCKVLQLFAYVGRYFIANPADYTTIFGDGTMKLLTLCPKEVVWGRRDILGAIKHIANSDWRVAFIPHIPRILDLDFLLGSASGSRELLKGSAIQCAMDVIHSMRHQLNVATYAEVISLCIAYCSDRSLGMALHMIIIRTLSTNLMEGIITACREEDKLEEGRFLFIRLLNMFSLRLKVMVKYSLPAYKTRAKNAALQHVTVDPNEMADNAGQLLLEQRSFLRALLAGTKSFLFSIRELVVEGDLAIRPEDLKIVTRICKYSVQATELFVIGNAPQAKTNLAASGRSTEKEFTENVADAMKIFQADVYRDVFQHIFWRFLDLFKDDNLQPILSAFVNCFLPFPVFSGITTTIMLDVAIPRFAELAEAGHDISASVLQVLKILFGAVSLYPKEVEGYIKPLVQQIFHQGFDLSTKAKDPYNLFLMFRAFFRAMGGGGHEVLYQDFLPHLPMILQTLCTFHSQRQKPAFKDIFNELCLIVPVRLSTLMPHISLLAPAILSALRGPAQSMNQGLRTLELCIDNMQNDYLYEQLEPVKKELMKALWAIMTTGSGQTQVSAFRFLGKMCGQALKAIREPQPLNPRLVDDDVGPCLSLQFSNIPDAMHVPVFRVIEEAYKTLLDATVDINTRNAAWNVVHSYLLGILRPDESIQKLESLLRHPSFKTSGKTGSYAIVYQMNPDSHQYPKCVDEKNRLAAQTCLQGLLVAAATKDLREKASPLLAKFVRHFTLMAIVQQHAGFSKPESSLNRSNQVDAIDPFVLVDAIVIILGHEEPAINKIGDAAVMVILEALNAVYENLKHCVGLPFLTYLIEKIYSLFYEPSFCCKLGALSGFAPLIDFMPVTWTMEMSVLLIRALMFVLRDSFQKMTYGALDVTKKLMDHIVNRILVPTDRETNKGSMGIAIESLPQEIQVLRTQAINELVKEFIQGSTSVIEEARKQAMKGLTLISELLDQPLGEILEPHKKLIAEFVPPKGSPSSLKAYQMTQQTALLEANRFFLMVTPTVVSYNPDKPDDMQIVRELMDFVTQADHTLQNSYHCFQISQYHPQSFIPYRVAAFRLLALFHSIKTEASKIHKIFFDTLVEGPEELHDVVVECLTEFEAKVHVNETEVIGLITSCKEKLQDPAAWVDSLTNRLCRLQTVYPQFFAEEFASIIFASLAVNLDLAVVDQKNTAHVSPQVKKCAGMITLLGRVSKELQKYIPDVISLVLQTEDILMTRNGRVLTNALTGFLTGYAAVVIDLFFQDERIFKPRWIGFFEKLMKSKDDFTSEVKRILINDKSSLLLDLIRYNQDTEDDWTKLSVGIRLLYLLTKKDPQWLVSRADIRTVLREVWRNPAVHGRLRNITVYHHETWDLSVKFLVLLMVHVRTNPDDLDALFEITTHNNKSISEASRWRQFMETFIIFLNQHPTKRRAMVLKWLDLVQKRTFSDEHLAEICEWVIQPLLKQQFMQPNAEVVIYDASKPDQNNQSGNLISMIVQTVLADDLIYNVSDVLRVAILKLFVLFTESGERFFPDGLKSSPQNHLLARFCYVGCNFLQKRERDHIQVDIGTIIQCQNLLAQISGKNNIPVRFYQTIMKSLFACGGVEPRGANKAAIDILLPNLLTKNQDGAKLLCLYLRRCVTDDVLSVSSNNSMIFHSIVRHYSPLFPFRHNFISIFIANAHKNGLSNSSSLELKKTSLEMAECLVHWEAMYKRVEFDIIDNVNENVALRVSRPRRPGSPSGKDDKDMEQRDVDNLANILMRLSFVFGDTNNTDSFGRRCIKLLKFFMRRDMHPNADLRLIWLDKILSTVDQIKIPASGDSTTVPGQIPSICLALETLTYFIPLLARTAVLPIIQEMSASLVKVATCYNARIGRCMHNLIAMLCSTWPGDPLLRNLPLQLESLYAQIIKVIHEGLSEYEKSVNPHQTQIFCTLMLLKATIPHVPSVLDRLLSLVINVAKKVSDEHLVSVMKQQQAQQAPSPDGVVSAELVVVILDIIKVSQFYASATPSHRQTILTIMLELIGRGGDVRVYRALIRIFTDWLHLSVKEGDAPAVSSAKHLPKVTRKTKKKKNEDDFGSSEFSSEGADMKKKKTKKNQLDFPGLPPPVPVEDPQSVTPRELSALILKLQLQLERRFGDDAELQEMYTLMIYNIHTSDDTRLEELRQRLLNTYMYGLRHPNPEWRSKFYQIHDQRSPNSVYERLMSIFNGINWDACTLTYYIGFCLNSILGIANTTCPIHLHNIKLIQSVAVTGADYSSGSTDSPKHADNAAEQNQDLLDTSNMEISADEPRRLKELSIEAIAQRVYELNNLTRGNTTKCMLDGIFQLCHMKNQLANDLWILVLPQLWKLFSGEQRDLLLTAFKSFLMTHSHQAQRDLVHSPIQAMFDAMVRCEGVQLKLHPMSILFLGERQNLWYRSVLLLEDMAVPPQQLLPNQKGGHKAAQQLQALQPSVELDSSVELNQLIHGVLWGAEESLARMYTAVGEDDFSAAVWQLRGTLQSKSEPSVTRPIQDFRAAIGFERQGMYFSAKDSYEKAMDTFLSEYQDKPVSDNGFGELQVLTECYTDTLKQLNQWPALYNLAVTETINNPCLALEAAWHQDSFDIVSNLLQNTDKQVPPREELNYGFCKAYNSLYKVLREGLNSSASAYKEEGVDRLIDCLQQVCIKMWRHLPRTGTLAHRPLIEMATRVGDLKELLNVLPGLHSGLACNVANVGNLKTLVKNWKLRIPSSADDTRFWSELCDLRSQVLTHVINLSSDVQQQSQIPEVASSLSAFPILSIHTISQNFFSFSKAARAQHLPKLSIDVISRVQTLPVVPLVDCFERLKTHVMSSIAIFDETGDQTELQLALDAIDSVTMQYFTKEMHADLLVLRAQVCTKLQKNDDAYKLLSASVQVLDTCFEGWLKFGDYYEAMFYKNPTDLLLAKQAVIAYSFGAKSSCDSMARECCAKMLALLNHEDSSGIISSAIEETAQMIPQQVLVFWVPQLIHLMMRKETAQAACILLSHVAKNHPQPVYLHARTYFQLMKVVDLSKDSTSPMGASISSQPGSEAKQPNKRRRQNARDLPPLPMEDCKSDPDAPTGDGSTMPASNFVLNCVNIMRTVSESHPTICNALESFANQVLAITMSADRFYEELLAHLSQALKTCYVQAFEHRDRVMQAKMTTSMIQYMNTIVRSFGTGVYQEPGSVGGPLKTFGDVASEAITRRAQVLQASADYNKLKKDFMKDFDCTDADNLKTQSIINKLKKWIRILEKTIKSHPSQYYLDSHHRPLINFTILTAEIELPGDFSMQRNLHTNKVVQILPRMDVVFKHNVVCRRIYFVNNVGDTIPYLIVADNANTVQGRKEERILQLFMALNPILDEFPESSRRALKFYVPKVTPIAPAVRLMEDSQQSVCIWDIYKKFCDKKNIDSDGPIMKFYERIVASIHRNQGATSPAVLKDCLKETQMQMVQARVLRDFFSKLYSNVDEYFLFRKSFMRSHALLSLTEYLLRLTKLTPDMMHVHTDSGAMGVYSYAIELEESSEMARAVPFRLTPNLTEIFTCYGTQGPFHHSMVAAARAFEQSEAKFKAYVRTIFCDELNYWIVFRKEVSSILAFGDAIQDKGDPPASASGKIGDPLPVPEPKIPALLQRATKRIFGDLHDVAKFSGHDSAVLKLINDAKNPDNLCRMDPSWHPWL